MGAVIKVIEFNSLTDAKIENLLSYPFRSLRKSGRRKKFLMDAQTSFTRTK